MAYQCFTIESGGGVRPIIQGDPPITPRNWNKANLFVGDLIHCVGRRTERGTLTSSCRKFEFVLPLEYAGCFSYKEGEHDESSDSVYLAFRIDKSFMENGYLLFAALEDSDGELREIIWQDFRRGGIDICKPAFHTDKVGTDQLSLF